MNKFLQELKEKVLIFDGSKGTMLQKLGLKGGECPELWNIEHPELVKKIYLSYIEAGSDVIQTNTFGANRAILEKFGLQDKVDLINSTSVKLAKEAAGDKVYVAASIGPTGKLLEPSGELTFEEAYDIFKEQVKAVTYAGADIINFETMSDLMEMRAAILAARENSPLPIIASMTFQQNGYTLMGNNPQTCALTCEALGADVIGANCSTGPEGLIKIIKNMHSLSSLTLCVKANAGLPECLGDDIIYSETPDTFKNSASAFVENGVKLIGGCCGTTPEFISAIKGELTKSTFNMDTTQPKLTTGLFICSGSKYINVENIEKSKIGFFVDNSNAGTFKQNLNPASMDIIADRTFDLTSQDYDVIYLNLDTIVRPELSMDVVKTFQTYSKLPLIFQAHSSASLEYALRVYNGKAGVVIDHTDDYTFDLIISAKKYGSTMVDKSLIF